MSIKKGDDFSPAQKENQAANYRKLWLRLKVDAPFMLQITKLQKDWNLPLIIDSKDIWKVYTQYLDSLRIKDKGYFEGEEFKKIAPIVSSVFNLNLPDEVTRTVFGNLLYNLPSIKFKRAVKELLKRFDFEDFWLQSLSVYIVTDKIYPPFEERSKDCPPEHVIEDWKIFILTAKKMAQHDFLKKQGLTTKQISELEENTDKLPDKLIHSNLDIAQKVWGDWGEMSKDKSMINLAKKRYERFDKFFVSLTEEDMRILYSLNLSTKKP